MQIKSVSASSYETWQWCQWKWFLTYNLGFRDESGPAAYIGQLAHKYLEVLSRLSIRQRYKDSKYWDTEYLWTIVYNSFQKRNKNILEEVKADKIKDIKNGLKYLMTSRYSPINTNTIGSEQYFSQYIERPVFYLKQNQTNDPVYLRINGIIDRIDKVDDETIEIIDYKTGTRTNYNSKTREKKDSQFLSEQIQPRIYHLAAQKLYPWAKNILVTFIFIADGGPVTIPFSKEDAEDTIEKIKLHYQDIRFSESPTKTVTWKCKSMCWFGKTGLCDELWKEKDNNNLQFLLDKYTILNNKVSRD